ncbi:hypothetical protein J3F83DRAFT_751033 [Trichoderma novae-zelandiae]
MYLSTCKVPCGLYPRTVLVSRIQMVGAVPDQQHLSTKHNEVRGHELRQQGPPGPSYHCHCSADKTSNVYPEYQPSDALFPYSL